MKLSSLVSEKNMATSVQDVTSPEPALSDLCPAVPSVIYNIWQQTSLISLSERNR